MDRRARLAPAALLLLGATFAGCASPTPDPAVEPPWSCPRPCEFPVDLGAHQTLEQFVSVRPGDPRHLLIGSASFVGSRENGGPVHLRVHVSLDGGRNFTTDRFPGSVPDGHPLARYTHFADPMPLVLEDGTALYVAMAGTGAGDLESDPASAWTNFDIVAARSPDGGLTWPEATVVARGVGVLGTPLPPPVGFYHDQPHAARAPGPDDAGAVLLAWATVYLPASGPGQADIVASVSRDGGRTWTAPVPVAAKGPYHNARPQVLPDGTMYVAYTDSRATYERQSRLARSDDGGATWSPVPMPEIVSSKGPPLLATPGALYLAATPRAADGTEATELHVSHDGGASWRIVSSDRSAAPGWPTPALASDDRGRVYLTYLRASEDGSNALRALVLEPDGGTRMESVNRSAIGPNGEWGLLSWPAFGDYSGLAGAGDGAVASWISGDAPHTDLRITWIGRDPPRDAA